MCKAVKEMIEDGKKEVTTKSIKRLYENGVAIEVIAKSFEVSIENIMKLLNNECVVD